MNVKYGDMVNIRGIEGEIVSIEYNKTSGLACVTLWQQEGWHYREVTFDCVDSNEITPLEQAPTKEDKAEDNTMSNIKVTQGRIDHLMNTAKFEGTTVFDKCTVVAAKFENGFILVESSACVDPANYDKALGEKICKEAIRERLWLLEGYALQKGIYKLTKEM